MVPTGFWRSRVVLGLTLAALPLTARRGRRVLHDHQAYGRLAGWRRGHRGRGGILLGGVLPLAVVQDAGDEEDKEEDGVAGHQDDEVQGHGVNLQVEFHETHGDASYLAAAHGKNDRAPAGGARALGWRDDGRQ